MKPHKARALEDALKRHGFLLDRSPGDKIYYFWYQGKKTSVFTKISHGKGEELGFRILKKIQVQLHLDTQAQLSAFIDGTMDTDGYMAHLRAKKVILDPVAPSPAQR